MSRRGERDDDDAANGYSRGGGGSRAPPPPGDLRNHTKDREGRGGRNRHSRYEDDTRMNKEWDRQHSLSATAKRRSNSRSRSRSPEGRQRRKSRSRSRSIDRKRHPDAPPSQQQQQQQKQGKSAAPVVTVPPLPAAAAAAAVEQTTVVEVSLDAEMSAEEIQMMMAMGIPFGFDSTQGKKVDDEAANTGAVKVKTTRTARQYMNRRGGFNKMLPAEVTGKKVSRD